jgi:hypothetical protein
VPPGEYRPRRDAAESLAPVGQRVWISQFCR